MTNSSSHYLLISVSPVRAVAVQPEGVDVHRARLPPRQPLRPTEVLRVLHLHLGEIQSLQWTKSQQFHLHTETRYFPSFSPQLSESDDFYLSEHCQGLVIGAILSNFCTFALTKVTTT